MDEAVIRGLIIGAVFGLIGLAANLVWRLIRSTSEGARRIKIVGAAALVILIVGVIVSAMGPVGAIGTGIVIAATVWVFIGFKKKSLTPLQKIGTAPPEDNWTAKEATEFVEVKEDTSQRKTVITCPNCAGRLRVVTGKYIDVTCPHCKTVFRTHS